MQIAINDRRVRSALWMASGVLMFAAAVAWMYFFDRRHVKGNPPPHDPLEAMKTASFLAAVMTSGSFMGYAVATLIDDLYVYMAILGACFWPAAVIFLAVFLEATR